MYVSFFLTLSIINRLRHYIIFLNPNSSTRNWFILSVVCGQTYHTKNSGVISSPNYPSSYPNNADCTYTIQLDQSYDISFVFSLPFDLEKGFDYIEVTFYICNKHIGLLYRYLYPRFCVLFNIMTIFQNNKQYSMFPGKYICLLYNARLGSPTFEILTLLENVSIAVFQAELSFAHSANLSFYLFICLLKSKDKIHTIMKFIKMCSFNRT